MLLDRKLDIEHLYAGNKICFVCGDLNLEIREKFFFSYFLQFFFFKWSRNKISVCSKYTVQCFVSEQHLLSFKNFFHNALSFVYVCKYLV